MKLGQWMMMISGMILVLSLMGLEIPGLNPINQAVGLNVTNGTTVSADLESSTIFSALFGSDSEAIQLFGISLASGILLSLLAGGVVTAGLYIITKDTAILILPILIIIAGLYASTFVSVVSYFDVGWARSIAVSIFGIISIGFLMSILDYFLNR